MFDHLRIEDRRERALVGLADLGLTALGPLIRATARGGRPTTAPRRILLLRLERIGDLVMVLEAIAAVRSHAPDAQIDLVVGSWNVPLATLVGAVDRVETLDAPWMARGATGTPWLYLARRAHRWRARHYDLAINFEGDIRSHLLMGLSGAPRRVGFGMAGGGPVLTDVVDFDPTAHVAVNARRLVSHVFDPAGGTPPNQAEPRPRLVLPDDARRRALALLRRAGARRTLIGIQPGAGRAVKEWDPTRLATVAAALADGPDVSLVVNGGPQELRLVTAFLAALPSDRHVVCLPGHLDLVGLAAILERLALFITPDSGPMHLAAAVGTPVLAIFGPSLPSRYAPLSTRSRIVRIDLPCSPCNLLRHPPDWCVGHIPDCLAGIEAAPVLAAAREMLI